MAPHELLHLELLAEVDALMDSAQRWGIAAPNWQTARTCQALVRRLAERTQTLRIRMEAPLVVATLGGTGVGKSALVNALAGAEVVETGRSRPTTRRPRLICRPDLSAQMLGIPSQAVELVQRELPALSDLVIIDCPDPDTTEEPDATDSNLARLRQILPHCDVLLVATTQQKYRSARVFEELNLAATGAQLVFVQTHSDTDEDIRDDWRQVLEQHYATGRIFFVDSLAALADAQQGLHPRGEFAGLLDLLTRQLAGAAATRIRRANFLDLVSATLDVCGARIEEGRPAVRQLEAAISEQRARLAAQMTDQMRSELLSSRQQWETRLIGQIVSRWGFSPFSMVLRVFQGLGGILSGALLFRARTPAQVALWGAVQGARTWQRHRQGREADTALGRAAAGWDTSALRSAALVVDGYAMEAGLSRESTGPEAVAAEAAAAGQSFIADVSAELESLIDRAAQRHIGWFTRWRYELLLLTMVGILVLRLAKNFFYDSWLAPEPVLLYGVEFYVLALFWLLLWCLLLLWAFTRRLRRGLQGQVNELSEGWNHPKSAAGIFAQLEAECRRIERFESDLNRIQQDVASLRHRLVRPEEQLGHRR